MDGISFYLIGVLTAFIMLKLENYYKILSNHKNSTTDFSTPFFVALIVMWFSWIIVLLFFLAYLKYAFNSIYSKIELWFEKEKRC